MPSTLAYGNMLMDPILPNMGVAMTVSLSKVIPVDEQVLVKQPKRNDPESGVSVNKKSQPTASTKGMVPMKPMKPMKFSEQKNKQ